jgi:hypothetical protein
MNESGGISVSGLTAGGQTVATDFKGNITTLPANLRPSGSIQGNRISNDCC